MTSPFGINTNLPETFVLKTNYPNPFNPSTTLSYGIPESATVSLIIYDLRGKTINTLVSESQTAGWYHYSWYGQNQNGEQVSTGLYFARLQANTFSQVIELVYLR
jgi:flagellar hook assembly protein FlgD